MKADGEPGEKNPRAAPTFRRGTLLAIPPNGSVLPVAHVGSDFGGGLHLLEIGRNPLHRAMTPFLAHAPVARGSLLCCRAGFRMAMLHLALGALSNCPLTHQKST
jgi:hypothetical protein